MVPRINKSTTLQNLEMKGSPCCGHKKRNNTIGVPKGFGQARVCPSNWAKGDRPEENWPQTGSQKRTTGKGTTKRRRRGFRTQIWKRPCQILKRTHSGGVAVSKGRTSPVSNSMARGINHTSVLKFVESHFGPGKNEPGRPPKGVSQRHP